MYTITLHFHLKIQSLNVNIIKSAQTDGANDLKIFLKIIIPYIKGVIVLIAIIAISSAMQIYVEVSLITKGGPGTSTQTLALYLYRKVFTYVSEYGYSTLIGMVMFIISIVLTIGTLLVKKNEKK